MQLLPLLLLVATTALASTGNVCRDNAACCQVFTFERPSAWNSAPFVGVSTVAVPAGAAGQWADQGVEFTIDEVDPISRAPYALGLVNVSVGASSITEVTGAATLAALESLADGLVLSAYAYYNTTLRLANSSRKRLTRVRRNTIRRYTVY